MGGVRIELGAVRVREAENLAGKAHDGHLQSQADPQEGDLFFARVLRGEDDALDPAVPEAAGDDDPVRISEQRVRRVPRQVLRLDPGDIDLAAVRDAAVLQRLDYGKIGVVELRILSDEGDADSPFGMPLGLHHLLPVREIRRRACEMQALQHGFRQVLPLHDQRDLIEIFHVRVFQDMGCRDITEEGDLFPDALCQRVFRAAHQNVRLDADLLETLHAHLGGLGLQLAGDFQVGDQGHMDHDHIFAALLPLELADRLQEGQTFDVADSAAHLDDRDLLASGSIGRAGRIPGSGSTSRGGAAGPVKAGFDLVGDVRDDLHRTAAVVPVTLLVQDRPVNLAGSHVGVVVEALVDEALVVSQIQVGLRAVIRDEDLAVLDGIHGPGIHVDVGIEFLHSHAEAPCLQKAAQRCGRDAFSKTGHDAAGHKYIFHRGSSFLPDTVPRVPYP